MEEHQMRTVTLKIEQDPNPTDPCEHYNSGTIWCWSKTYTLGNKNGRDLLIKAIRKSKYYDKVFNHFLQSGKDKTFSWGDNQCLFDFAAQCDDIVMTPIFLYDSEGITLGTNHLLFLRDNDQVGVAFMTLDTAKDIFGNLSEDELRAKALECLENEIALYNDYLNGQIYSYEIINDYSNDVIHSCGDINGKDEAVRLALDDFEYYVKKHA